MAPSARDRFVLEHLALVDPIARRMKRKLPPGFDLEDLIHDGILGLLKAGSTYNPTLGASERTWARRKITHAIQEAVRGKPYTYATTRAALTLVERHASAETIPLPDRSAELEAALAALTAQQRELIESIYESNESFKSLRNRRAGGLSWRGIEREYRQALETMRPLLQRAA